MVALPVGGLGDIIVLVWFPDNPPTPLSVTWMTNDNDGETRTLVLKYIAKRKQDHPKKPYVYRKDMLKDLKIEETVLDSHIHALSDQYLIYIQIPMPYMPWTHANITAIGAMQVEE